MTNSEVYLYKNEKYNFVIYRDKDCLNDYINQNIIMIPKMDFGNCYNNLKENYSLLDSQNITTILLDIPRRNQSSYTYYNFYHPETGDTLDFMNICKNNISKSISISSFNMNNKNEKKMLLSQGIDIFDPSSPFFTDICYNYISPNKRDIPLKERILDYFPNIKLCDEGCKNLGIDYEKYEVKCECTFSNIINNDIINNYFTGEIVNLISETNLDVLECYNSIFIFGNLKENYGGLIIICLIIVQIILNIFYSVNGFVKARQFAIGLMFSFINLLNKNNNDKTGLNFINSKNNHLNIEEEKNSKNNNLNLNKNIDDNTYYEDKKNIGKNDINNNLFPPRKKTKRTTAQPLKNSLNISNYHEEFSNSNSKQKIIFSRKHTKNLSGYIRNTIKYKNTSKKSLFKDKSDINNKYIKKNENENFTGIIFQRYKLSEKELFDYMEKSPEEMIYEEALTMDKRTFGTMYLDILKNKQSILNIIYEDNKFKSKIFKVIILILSIDLYLVINGLFFSESYIDEIYLSKKEEKFFTFIPRSISRIIYLSLVTVVVNFLINCILIDENKIKSALIREQNDLTIMRGEIGKILFQMEKHIKIFIIINYIIMAFSWYYICCFNYVYKYTKTEWIKSSVFIIILDQIFPFVYSFIIALLRYLSLKCNSEQIYKISSSL